MSKDNEDVKQMNVYEKLLKIADMAGVLQKKKEGYNYKYVAEDEIQAKITAGMKKYHVMLLPSIRPDTLRVSPHQYVKYDKRLKQDVNVNGVCVGFTMTAVFDSYYQYGTDSVRVLKDGNYSNYELKIPNLSDIQEYVYPIVELTVSDSADNTVSIINQTDDGTREFKLVNIPANIKIVIDNELKIIDGSGISLSDFNKNWLRLRKGVNKLTITMKGSLKITCPQYACLGF